METPLRRPPATPTPLGRGIGKGGVRPIPPLPNIQQQFVSGTTEALERGAIGQIFFGGTAEAVDHHLSTALDRAPPDLLPYLRAFCTQVADLSLAFHRTYTSGAPPLLHLAPRATNRCRDDPTSPSTSTPSLGPVGKISYAQTIKDASAPDTATPQNPLPPPPPVTSKLQKNKKSLAKPDLRVFIRLPLDAPERKHSALAIHLALCDLKIGCSELVQEVLSVNSGFAIVPNSEEARATLLSTKKAFIQTLFHAARIEASQDWAVFRLSGIPRSVETVQINEKGAIISTLIPTTPSVVTAAIEERIRAIPTKVDIATSSLSDGLFYTS